MVNLVSYDWNSGNNFTSLMAREYKISQGQYLEEAQLSIELMPEISILFYRHHVICVNGQNPNRTKPHWTKPHLDKTPLIKSLFHKMDKTPILKFLKVYPFIML